MSIKPPHLRWLLAITTALVFVFADGRPAAASIWTKVVSGNASGSWGDAANWSGGIPNATNAVADFSALNIGVNSTVTNDAARTVGALKFADVAPGNNWTLTGSSLTLATSSGAPIIDVSPSQTTTVALGLGGSQGFIKSGAGTLLLSGGTANTIGGTIVITNGSIQTPNGASLRNVTASIVVATGTELRVGGNFDNNANSCPLVLNGTGDGNGSEGALHGSYNQTMNGPITLNSDSKISHDWNLFTLNGPITAASGSNNLELAITVSGQATLAANGNVNLGLGTLKVSSMAGGAPVALGGSNTLGGVVVQANGTVLFGSVNAIGGSGPKVAINHGGTAALNGTDLNPLLTRVVTDSAGAIALNGASSSIALNFGNYTNLSLGSVGNSTYSGVLTPGGGNYQLGGGGGALTVSSGLTSPGAGLVVNGNTSSSTVILTGSHTYPNATIIRGGTLMVTGVLSGPLVVQSGGTLSVGVATSTIGTLTVSNSVVLGGSSVFAINRSGAQKADRLVASSLVLDGTLTVNNVGAAPVLGDSFQLFSISGALSTAQPVLNLPPLAGGLRWDVSQLAVDGTIKVAQLTNVVGEPNWPSLLAQEIQSAYNAGYSNVTINPGTYVMENGVTTAFVFTGWNNFTINASNTIFVVDQGVPFLASCFSLNNCTNVTLAGATVRAKVYPFTQGRVIAIGTNSGVLYCNWQISEGYPTNTFNWWFNAVHASNTVVNLEQGDIYYENRYGLDGSGVASNAVYLGNRTWQLKFPGWLTSFSFQTNDWLVARAGGQGFAYYLNGSTNCTLLVCVSQSGGFATFRENLGGGNRMLDCLIQPAPEPPVGGTEPPVIACAADGVHTTFTYPGLHVENLVCQGVFLDDCITIHGNNNDVVSSSGNTVTFDGAGRFIVGDPVRIYSSNGSYFAQANCTAIQNVGGGNYQLTLDQSLSIPGGCAGENPKYNGAGYKIINCQLGNVRSRAILNKADNGLVTGCTIQNASTAMTFGPEIYWGGGGYSWNLNITNNTMVNCGRGIFFDTAGAIGNLNNTIQNNYFQDVALGRAIHVNSSGNLTIDGNLFVNPAPDYNLIYLSQTTNIVLRRNFVTNQTSAISLIGTGSGVSGLQYVANGIIPAGQKRMFNQYSSLVLDGGASPVVQNTAAGAANPVFTLRPVGNGFCVFGSGSLVLDAGNATNAGSSLQVNAYAGGDGQLWSLWPVGTTNVIVVNKLSGLAADVTSTSAGTTVIQSVINTNATNMHWYLQAFTGSGSTNSQSGVWVRLVSGNASGVWGTNANWSAGTIATGTGAVADFTANNVTVNSIVTNETARTIGSLRFNNTTTGRFWNVDGSTNRQLTLATSSGQPSINVTNTQVFLGGFNGTQGFVKNGNGVWNIFGSTYNNNVSGSIQINAGSLTTANGRAFQNITGDITVAAGATFGANAAFDGSVIANNIYLSGTGVGTPPGYVNGNTAIPSSPVGEVYNASTMPWGALDIYGNATLSGTITLNTDSKITHSWNYGTINGPIVATGAGKNLELRTYQSGQLNLIINGSISLGTGALTVTGTGTQGVTLGNSNNFSGGTYLTAGVLKMGNPNALGSGAISVGGGATLDVSGLSSAFVLGGSQTLSNGASGTGIINGSLNASGRTVSVTYNNGTPSLSVSNGTFTLSAATAFTINNTGPALALGTYPIITTSGAGVVGGVAPASVNVVGGGLSGGATASLQISGGTLNLVVVNPVAPTPTILPVYSDGLGNVVIRTDTSLGYNYLLLSTTNLTPPVVWVTNSTTAGTGGIITNTVPVTTTPPNQFFRFLVQ